MNQSCKPRYESLSSLISRKRQSVIGGFSSCRRFELLSGMSGVKWQPIWQLYSIARASRHCCHANVYAVTTNRFFWNWSGVQISGANPTITSYNASVVKIYSTINSVARLYVEYKLFFHTIKTLWSNTTQGPTQSYDLEFQRQRWKKLQLQRSKNLQRHD
jgi:hypothetical protein